MSDNGFLPFGAAGTEHLRGSSQMTESNDTSATDVGLGRRVAIIAVLMGMATIGGFAALVSPAQAKPEYLDAFNKKYGTRSTKLDSCQTCHASQSPNAQNLNPYGTDLGKHNHDFGAIEGLDSDGDGFKNIDEINATTFPGDPNDNPNTKAKPKPTPTTTTTKPFPFSLLPDLPHAANAPH